MKIMKKKQENKQSEGDTDIFSKDNKEVDDVTLVRWLFANPNKKIVII